MEEVRLQGSNRYDPKDGGGRIVPGATIESRVRNGDRENVRKREDLERSHARGEGEPERQERDSTDQRPPGAGQTPGVTQPDDADRRRCPEDRGDQ